MFKGRFLKKFGWGAAAAPLLAGGCSISVTSGPVDDGGTSVPLPSKKVVETVDLDTSLFHQAHYSATVTTNPNTRDVTVKLQVQNSEGKTVPGSFFNTRARKMVGDTLTIPGGSTMNDYAAGACLNGKSDEAPESLNIVRVGDLPVAATPSDAWKSDGSLIGKGPKFCPDLD